MVNGEVLKRNEDAPYGMWCDEGAFNVNVRALKGDALMGNGDKTNISFKEYITLYNC